jgi:glycolate oxidase FAD binding subunit
MSRVEDYGRALESVSGAECLRREDGGWTVSPGSMAEAAATLRFANEERIAVCPWGGGTKQGWVEGARPGVILRTHRMSRVLEHTWQDMTCTVEAGCTWAAMQVELARHGQFVALDPLWPERATVGGVCAANDSGALRLKYGSLRDLVIGMTIVLADGTVAKTGGKVVKNVAGYDLHKLMTGAFGTLGLITEVTFRLHSMARDTRSVTVSSRDVEPLGRFMLKLMDSHRATQSIQLRGDGEGFHLDVRLAALPQVLEVHGRGLVADAVGMGLATAATEAEVWTARERLFGSGDCVVFKATMLPTMLAEVAGTVHALGGSSVGQSVGVLTGRVPVMNWAGVATMRQRLEATGGSLVVLERPEEMVVDRWGAEPSALPLMREIKRQFDLKGTMNPGRFLGGI